MMTRPPRVHVKLRLLAPLLIRDRSELRERIRTIVDSRLDRILTRSGRYEPTKLDAALALMQKAVGAPLERYLAEDALADIEAEVARRVELARDQGPFGVFLNADPLLARLCYGLARAIRPEVALETGVGYGMTSAFLLRAMEENGEGVLHSVDLAPLAPNARAFVGMLVPPSLRVRWQLHSGGSRTILPRLLPALPPVGLFVHDSAHTYAHMSWEFRSVRPRLAARSVLLSDDVEGNRAFEEFVNRESPACWTVVQQSEKSSLSGVAVFG